MSTTEFLLLVGLGLVVWGLLTAWVAGRFGEERFGWGIAGGVLGPLCIPALVSAVKARRRGTEVPEPPPGESRGSHPAEPEAAEDRPG